MRNPPDWTFAIAAKAPVSTGDGGVSWLDRTALLAGVSLTVVNIVLSVFNLVLRHKLNKQEIDLSTRRLKLDEDVAAANNALEGARLDFDRENSARTHELALKAQVLETRRVQLEEDREARIAAAEALARKDEALRITADDLASDSYQRYDAAVLREIEAPPVEVDEVIRAQKEWLLGYLMDALKLPDEE